MEKRIPLSMKRIWLHHLPNRTDIRKRVNAVTSVVIRIAHRTTPWIVALLALLFLWGFYSVEIATPNIDETIEKGFPSTIGGELPAAVISNVANITPKPTPTPTNTATTDVKTSPLAGPPAEWPETPFAALPPHSQRPLILYAFFETETALFNLNFFLAHGLHGAADFLFVLNGETDAHKLIPSASNIRYHRRENKCYDLGAFAEVLTTDEFYKGYKKYVLMNASIRGPFMPHWADGCWTDMYLNKLNAEVKLVGMALNCDPQIHVQSMVWALDYVGLETLLYPNEWTISNFREVTPPPGEPLNPYLPIPYLEIPGINSCPSQYWEAVSIEVSAALLLVSAGYKFDVMMNAYAAIKEKDGWSEECRKYSEMLQPGHYYGGNVSPFEMLFVKPSRHANDEELNRLTGWVNDIQYSSWDSCGA